MKFIETIEYISFLKDFYKTFNYPGFHTSKKSLEMYQHLNFMVSLFSESELERNYKYIMMFDNSVNKFYFKNLGDGFLYDQESDLIIKKIEYKFRDSECKVYQKGDIIKFYKDYSNKVDVIHLGFFNQDILQKQEIPEDYQNFFIKTTFSEEYIQYIISKVKTYPDLINSLKPKMKLAEYVINEKILKL